MAVQTIDGESNSGQAIQLGIALIVLGLLAMGTILGSGAIALTFIGWIIVLAGLAEGIHAFRARRSDGFLFHLIPAVAGVPIGLLIATHPGDSAIAWMLLFASFFTVIGSFRTISAFWLKFPHWRWTVFEGITTLVLGSVMWTGWIWLLPWFLGFAVGLSLILRGWSSIMLAVALRRRHRERSEEQQRRQPRRQAASGFAPN
jgi:uncharacterized membrane protein HdeD (DUF308 family)